MTLSPTLSVLGNPMKTVLYITAHYPGKKKTGIILSTRNSSLEKDKLEFQFQLDIFQCKNAYITSLSQGTLGSFLQYKLGFYFVLLVPRPGTEKFKISRLVVRNPLVANLSTPSQFMIT